MSVVVALPTDAERVNIRISNNPLVFVSRDVRAEAILASDPTSMIFWLKNRKSKQWRDKQEIGGQMTINYIVPELQKDDG